MLYGNPYKSKMKSSLAVTFRVGPRFLAMLWICCAILVQISALDKTVESLAREVEQNVDLLSSDGTEPAEKQPLLHRERRAVKNNASPNLPDIEKRVQAIEKRLDALLHLPHRSSDSSLFTTFLLGWFGGNHGKDLKIGPPGPPGKTGQKGEPGIPGPKGDQGTHGPKGDLGATGRKGTAGPQGPKGDLGATGRNGTMGPQGLKGDLGATGRNGAKGSQGTEGKKGQDGAGKSGVKYVRWGRTTCPSGALIVYKGIIGGEHFSHTGGGVNYLCLPNNPKYDKYKSNGQSAGLVYITEYETHSFNPFKKNLYNHDAPCVICFVMSRGSMLMVPARNDCPSGWTEEYHGYLMTSYHGHPKPTDFICVDGDAEAVPGSSSNKNGALLYPVEGQCGSLPCGPYISKAELTCAVCTK